jgi:hypothetical protein
LAFHITLSIYYIIDRPSLTKLFSGYKASFQLFQADNSVFQYSNANDIRATQDLNSFGEMIAHAQCSVDEKKLHVSSRNMFPTTRNLQIRVHVYQPRHCCGD